MSAALSILLILGVVIGGGVALWSMASGASRPVETTSVLPLPQTDLNTRVTVRNAGKTGRTLTLRELLND